MGAVPKIIDFDSTSSERCCMGAVSQIIDLDSTSRILYTNLLTSCKLHAHLADINEEATEMFDRLVEQMAKQEGITEKLKSEDMMAWVARMNNIRNRAMEIVNNEIIYN